jgi:hypothetical protein
MKTSTDIFKFTIPLSYKIAIFGLLTLAAVIYPKASHAQINPIDAFFHANYNVTNLDSYSNRDVGQVSYLLVDWNEFNDVQQRYLGGGYVKLGESGWQQTGGIPYREAAIAYARFIGADAAVYTTRQIGKYDTITGVERTEHTIGFYARVNSARVAFTDLSGSANQSIDQAEAQLQAVWDRLPTAKKNALRSKEYAFINRNYRFKKTNPTTYLRLINERTAFIEEGHAEMFPE